MGIGMAQAALGQQLAMDDQFLDHRAIGVAVLAFLGQDALAREHRHMRRIGTIGQDQAEGIGIVLGVIAVLADQQFEIVFAMSWRIVNKTGAGIGSDEGGRQHRHVKRVTQAAERMRRHQC